MVTSPLPERTANFDLYSVIMNITNIKQWRFYNVPHLVWHGPSVQVVIFEDPWHLQLLASVKQWSCHWLFIRHRLEFEHPTFGMQGERSNRLRHHHSLREIRNILWEVQTRNTTSAIAGYRNKSKLFIIFFNLLKQVLCIQFKCFVYNSNTKNWTLSLLHSNIIKYIKLIFSATVIYNIHHNLCWGFFRGLTTPTCLMARID